MVWDDELGIDFPITWHPKEINIYKKMLKDLPPGAQDDRLYQALFHSAMFETGMSRRDKDRIYQAIMEYSEKQYGIQFDRVFNWREWKEWYDGIYPNSK